MRRPPGKNAGPCAIVIAAQIDQQVNTVGRDPARRPNIVITSHDPLVVESDVVDTVVTLRDGRIVDEK